MIKIGDMIIDPKRDLTPEQAKSLKEFLVSQRIRQGLNIDGSEDHINGKAMKDESPHNEDEDDTSSKLKYTKPNIPTHKLKFKTDTLKNKSKQTKFTITRKKIVTFFTLAYLFIIVFVPTRIPRVGINYVPFFNVGERSDYKLDPNYVYSSYIIELDIYILLMEIIIVSIIFAWSLYFFRKSR